ncbi:MAG: DUF2924 domain-containing protein [Planctomycetaceae bacterium]|nr:DUF2924 domain-containing protein [Planctomycetales bacterium]MCB9924952.1 DUF2924 domain-containing protein [Planctomycetaceae bacterium]
MLNIAKEVSAMERMTVDQLRSKYADVFGEQTNGRHKEWLIKRIAWRIQANAEGDLSERARRRAMELSNDADIRMTPPRAPKAHAAQPATNGSGDSRLPLPGTVLTRTYKGATIEVQVRGDGFEFEGERYKSLSAIAKAVTGSHWSGHRFFGLQKGGAK